MPSYVNQNLYPGEFLLHKKYATSDMLLELIWTHSNIVMEIALAILDRNTFDKTELRRELVMQAALLHDIGVYHCGGFEWIPHQPPQTRPYIQHEILGAWILHQEGYAAPIIQTAFSHTGVGLTGEDIRHNGLDLPERDYVPQTTFQKFMTYASKFHSKTPTFRTSDQIKEELYPQGQEKVDLFTELENTFGRPVITDIQEKYQSWEKNFSLRVAELTKTQSPLNLNASGIAKAA
jgi:uncharacterized protein